MPSKLSAQGQTKTPLLFVSCSMSGHHHCEPASPGGQRVAVLFSIPKNGESIVLRGRKGQESKHVFTGNKPASSKSVPGSPAGLKIPRKGLELHAVCFLSSPAVSSHPHSSTQWLSHQLRPSKPRQQHLRSFTRNSPKVEIHRQHFAANCEPAQTPPTSSAEGLLWVCPRGCESRRQRVWCV